MSSQALFFQERKKMKKNILMLAALGLVATIPAYYAFQANAQDDVEATADAAVDEVVSKTLADGTVVHVKGDAVTVVGADGTETPAPDGEHTLADGTTIKTMGGMLVHEESHEGEAHPAE
jgi:hypothetical protein